MNTYQRISSLPDEYFRRKTGVKRKTFKRMVEILTQTELEKKKRGGKPNKLSMEERLLMWLEYMREYRTYFHTGASYGVSESACYRNCVWIENTLVDSKEFALPKRTTPLQSDNQIEAIVVDATESPIERPKKSKDSTTRERKRDIRSRPR
jgi:hypothetical protein